MDSSLRIAHVQPLSIDLFGYRDDDWGTTFRYAVPNIAAAQLEQGHRPTVHLLSASGHRARRWRSRTDGIPVVFHPCLEPQRSGGVRRRFSRQFSISMLRALRSDDVDIVHFHGARSLQGMFGATALRSKQQRLPLVAQDHGPRMVGPVMRRVQLGALHRCDALLAANAESQAELRAKAPSLQVSVVPNGVDPRLFHPDEHQRHSRQPFRLLVVSRLMLDKDPLTMAHAVVEVARRGHSIELTVVGVGELRAEVEDVLRAASVPVTFVDTMTQQELATYYRAAHALMLTSLREGFNQATLEAMASGTPVVASDIGGIRDGVAGAGLLAPTGQVAAFADHLELLVTDERAWMECRDRCLDRARAFTWPAIATQIDQIYRHAMNNREQAGS